MNIDPSLAKDLKSLESAEDFLNFFSIEYDNKVVVINRLHILKRYNDYIRHNADDIPKSSDDQHNWLKKWLLQSYEDFVNSDAQTEKVFRVFRMTPREGGGSSTFVPLEEMFK